MSNDLLTFEEIQAIRKIVGDRSLIMNTRIYGDIAITKGGCLYGNKISNESNIYSIPENVSIDDYCKSKSKKGQQIYLSGKTEN